MVGSDYTIFAVSFRHMITADEKFWSKQLAIGCTLAKFLDTNDLAVHELSKVEGGVDANFVLRKSDVTGEGLAFLKKQLDPWLKSLDRGVDVDDLRPLERRLKKFREANAAMK
jgi:hypothetical protein